MLIKRLEETLTFGLREVRNVGTIAQRVLRGCSTRLSVQVAAT